MESWSTMRIIPAQTSMFTLFVLQEIELYVREITLRFKFMVFYFLKARVRGFFNSIWLIVIIICAWLAEICWLILILSYIFPNVKSGLQNDHKALMKEIEEGIHEVHARAREQKNSTKENQEDKEMAGIKLQR